MGRGGINWRTKSQAALAASPWDWWRLQQLKNVEPRQMKILRTFSSSTTVLPTRGHGVDLSPVKSNAPRRSGVEPRSWRCRTRRARATRPAGGPRRTRPPAGSDCARRDPVPAAAARIVSIVAHGSARGTGSVRRGGFRPRAGFVPQPCSSTRYRKNDWTAELSGRAGSAESALKGHTRLRGRRRPPRARGR